MNEQHREQAIQVVKNILHVLHEKCYEDLPQCVDEMEWSDTAEIRECIQGTLELNDLEAFDEYDVPSRFHPQYEYHQLDFYERGPRDSFEVDYDLTADGGEPADLCLQLGFVPREDGTLKSVFRTIDPR
ncbi:hypothetical protein [uncultured Oscillibacter sp.]|uniref:DUF7668 domain-containing protein n=1 Tax=uncultured Oscillibacter sp. TaxID=876091 RepID=UPI0026094670|nr:hypothetical protein [uncultured Oscillibacter sp.]